MRMILKETKILRKKTVHNNNNNNNTNIGEMYIVSELAAESEASRS